MKVDFKKFTGTLPYARELFGVFQPLLGWKSKRTKNIMDEESAKIGKGFLYHSLKGISL